jgi:hypothetical protein
MSNSIKQILLPCSKHPSVPWLVVLGVFLGALFGASTSALAIPSTLPIDFRTTLWNPSTPTTEETVGNITAFAAFPPGSVLTWSSTAGIGISAPGILALSPVDILNFTFTNGSGSGLTGAWVTNLFSGSAESGVLELVTTRGTDLIDFSGLNSTGDDFINFGGAFNVLDAEFLALNPTGNYSVKAIRLQALQPFRMEERL